MESNWKCHIADASVAVKSLLAHNSVCLVDACWSWTGCWVCPNKITLMLHHHPGRGCSLRWKCIWGLRFCARCWSRWLSRFHWFWDSAGWLSAAHPLPGFDSACLQCELAFLRNRCYSLFRFSILFVKYSLWYPLVSHVFHFQLAFLIFHGWCWIGRSRSDQTHEVEISRFRPWVWAWPTLAHCPSLLRLQRYLSCSLLSVLAPEKAELHEQLSFAVAAIPSGSISQIAFAIATAEWESAASRVPVDFSGFLSIRLKDSSAVRMSVCSHHRHNHSGNLTCWLEFPCSYLRVFVAFWLVYDSNWVLVTTMPKTDCEYSGRLKAHLDNVIR